MTYRALAKAMVVISCALAAVVLDPSVLPSSIRSLAYAGGFFVSTAGDDGASGSIAAPWRTFQHAFDELLPGDTLYVRGGIYYESPTLAVSGTATSPIVIMSYPGERGTLDSGTPSFRTIGNSDWELVDAARGEYRSIQPFPSGHIYAYVDGVPGYENGRVALVPYESTVHFRSTTDQYGASFYVGPGTMRIGDRIHVRLSKTSDLRATESKYGEIFATENADPRQYSILLTTDQKTLRITGAHLILRDLTLNAGKKTVQLRTPAHHVTFDGITAWRGNSVLEIEGAHHVKVTHSRIYGDSPYWVFWSDMKDVPAPADRLRGTSIDMSAGAHDIEIAYSHVRGSGNDLIATKDDEYNIVVHHNRIENAGDDAFEIEGTVDVGRVEIYENYILNALVAIAPGQATPSFTGPLLVYRNVITLLRPPPVNRAEGINSWNGGSRYGYNYMFKHGTHIEDVSRNTHYYHNTLVLLDSNERGLNIIPTDPTNCRIANNIGILVNGTVNHDIRTGPGFVLDGNLYWKINDLDESPLVASHQTVEDFHAATGFETHGLGNMPGRGTDPRLPAFQLDIVDPSIEAWSISADSEVFDITDFMPDASSPAIAAGIAIPAVPGLGILPDSRSSLDVGAIPHDADPAEFAMFPFDPTLEPHAEAQSGIWQPQFQRESQWRFHDLGIDLGSAWHEPGYDDATWGVGSGVFGYGEDFVTTPVSFGADPENKHPAVYFRKSFELVDAADVTGLELNASYDDGLVVYLNGTEVARRDMPEGAIAFATRARSHESGQTYERIDLSAHTALLNEGANVLAVEVHQSDAGSGDMVFDADLMLRWPESNLVAVPTSGPVSKAALRAWPVPMRGRTLTVQYASAAPAGKLELAVYDLAGRRVRTLSPGPAANGLQRATWDGRDARGASVANGVYLLKARQGAVLRSRKLVVVH